MARARRQAAARPPVSSGYVDDTWPFAVTEILYRVDQTIGIIGGPYEHLNGHDRAVLTCCVLRADKKNGWRFEITEETIARQIGFSKETVGKSLSVLDDVHLVLKGTLTPHGYVYRPGSELLKPRDDMPEGLRPYLARKAWYRRPSRARRAQGEVPQTSVVGPTDFGVESPRLT
jgi:hypothetical protein